MSQTSKKQSIQVQTAVVKFYVNPDSRPENASSGRLHFYIAPVQTDEDRAVKLTSIAIFFTQRSAITSVTIIKINGGKIGRKSSSSIREKREVGSIGSS